MLVEKTSHSSPSELIMALPHQGPQLPAALSGASCSSWLEWVVHSFGGMERWTCSLCGWGQVVLIAGPARKGTCSLGSSVHTCVSCDENLEAGCSKTGVGLFLHHRIDERINVFFFFFLFGPVINAVHCTDWTALHVTCLSQLPKRGI